MNTKWPAQVKLLGFLFLQSSFGSLYQNYVTSGEGKLTNINAEHLLSENSYANKTTNEIESKKYSRFNKFLVDEHSGRKESLRPKSNDNYLLGFVEPGNLIATNVGSGGRKASKRYVVFNITENSNTSPSGNIEKHKSIEGSGDHQPEESTMVGHNGSGNQSKGDRKEFSGTAGETIGFLYPAWHNQSEDLVGQETYSGSRISRQKAWNGIWNRFPGYRNVSVSQDELSLPHGQSSNFVRSDGLIPELGSVQHKPYAGIDLQPLNPYEVTYRLQNHNKVSIGYKPYNSTQRHLNLKEDSNDFNPYEAKLELKNLNKDQMGFKDGIKPIQNPDKPAIEFNTSKININVQKAKQVSMGNKSYVGTGGLQNLPIHSEVSKPMNGWGKPQTSTNQFVEYKTFHESGSVESKPHDDHGGLVRSQVTINVNEDNESYGKRVGIQKPDINSEASNNIDEGISPEKNIEYAGFKNNNISRAHQEPHVHSVVSKPYDGRVLTKLEKDTGEAKSYGDIGRNQETNKGIIGFITYGAAGGLQKPNIDTEISKPYDSIKGYHEINKDYVGTLKSHNGTGRLQKPDSDFRVPKHNDGTGGHPETNTDYVGFKLQNITRGFPKTDIYSEKSKHIDGNVSVKEINTDFSGFNSYVAAGDLQLNDFYYVVPKPNNKSTGDHQEIYIDYVASREPYNETERALTQDYNLVVAKPYDDTIGGQKTDRFQNDSKRFDVNAQHQEANKGFKPYDGEHQKPDKYSEASNFFYINVTYKDFEGFNLHDVLTSLQKLDIDLEVPTPYDVTGEPREITKDHERNKPYDSSRRFRKPNIYWREIKPQADTGVHQETINILAGYKPNDDSGMNPESNENNQGFITFDGYRRLQKTDIYSEASKPYEGTGDYRLTNQDDKELKLVRQLGMYPGKIYGSLEDVAEKTEETEGHEGMHSGSSHSMKGFDGFELSTMDFDQILSEKLKNRKPIFISEIEPSFVGLQISWPEEHKLKKHYEFENNEKQKRQFSELFVLNEMVGDTIDYEKILETGDADISLEKNGFKSSDDYKDIFNSPHLPENVREQLWHEDPITPNDIIYDLELPRAGAIGPLSNPSYDDAFFSNFRELLEENHEYPEKIVGTARPFGHFEHLEQDASTFSGSGEQIKHFIGYGENFLSHDSEKDRASE